MVVNMEKYTISFMGVDEVERMESLIFFPFKEVKLSSRIKYLDFYLKPNDYTKKD